VDALVGPVDEAVWILERLRAAGFEVDASPSLLQANAANGDASKPASTLRRRVILSYGLGVDSTAILLRWLREPASRVVDGLPFELSDLTVLTAMVGDEWADSKEAVETHVLPLLREAGVRYVQVARRGHSESDGIEILDDSTAPTRLHIEGVYALSTELLDAGTIPTSGGLRKCSLKFKGWVLDTFLERDLAGVPYVHVIGFEADELSRVAKDQSFGGVGERTASYPLVEWGWNRAACLAYIRAATGLDWAKSACTFCPFSQGRGEVLGRYQTNPEAAASVLLMEASALALNPRMKLFSRKSMHEIMRREGNLGALRAFQARLDASEWAVYHVRRAFRSVSIADRSVERLAVCGSRADAEALLATKGRVVREGEHSFAYVHVTAKDCTFPCTEEYYVVGPAIAKPKTQKAFAKSWAKASAADVARGRRQLMVVK
jgi:hypothetical protein